MSQLHSLSRRQAGILLHPTSLPGPGAVGDLGMNAYWFVDFLQRSGLQVWQTLPLGPTHADGSPYQCMSALAGNEQLVSLQLLSDQGYLQHEVVRGWQARGGDEAERQQLLVMAADSFFEQADADEETQQQYMQFIQQAWVKDYSLFRTLKKVYDNQAWWTWPENYRLRDPNTLQVAETQYEREIAQWNFEQFCFFQQWKALKAYANERQVELFGDLPIFVAADSVDVWAERAQFQLDDEGKATTVAGVPPDYFSDTGQRWGNPHYDWDAMREDGFHWWIQRLRGQQTLFDRVRIDHFRGFEAYWSIPADAETAVYGEWVKGPGEALFTVLEAAVSIPLVAEDLGIITEPVRALRQQFGIPGMRILQFAFDGGAANPYLPHNYEHNAVVYTGTHDNNTTLGWFQDLEPPQQKIVCDYLDTTPNEMPWAMIQSALASVACLSIIPMQDFMSLDGRHRMNTPGTIEGNWQWRFEWEDVPEDLDKRLLPMIQRYGRIAL